MLQIYLDQQMCQFTYVASITQLSFQVEGSRMQQQFTQRVRKERPSGKLEVEGRVRITFPSRRLMTSLGEQREARDW